MNTSMLLSRARYTLGLLGTLGVVGLGLGMAALLLWGSVEKNMRQERAELNRSLQPVGAQLPDIKAAAGKGSRSQESQLVAFYAAFPGKASVPEILKRVYRAAETNGLMLDVGEYTQLQNSTERLVRYRVTLPVKGSFSQILLFIDKVLKEDNTNALESAAFKRDKVDDANVEAKLVFVIFADGAR